MVHAFDRGAAAPRYCPFEWPPVGRDELPAGAPASLEFIAPPDPLGPWVLGMLTAADTGGTDEVEPVLSFDVGASCL